MSEGRTSGQGGLFVIKHPAMSFWYHTHLFTKGNSTPQPKSGEMSTTSQSKERSLRGISRSSRSAVERQNNL